MFWIQYDLKKKLSPLVDKVNFVTNHMPSLLWPQETTETNM